MILLAGLYFRRSRWLASPVRFAPSIIFRDLETYDRPRMPMPEA